MATTDSKPTLSALKTPVSATYPSELRSPMVHSALTPTFLKREESLKTPISPPTAYLDFLKTLSPVLISPLATGTSSQFRFEAGSRPVSTASTTSITSAVSSASSTSCHATSAPADKTAPSSPGSSRSSSCCNCEKHEPPKSAPAIKTQTVTIPPPSPFSRPQSARTPRLYIPQSPYSPVTRSPMSAHSAHSAQSPYSAISPKTWDLEKKTGRTRRTRKRQHSLLSTPLQEESEESLSTNKRSKRSDADDANAELETVAEQATKGSTSDEAAT